MSFLYFFLKGESFCSLYFLKEEIFMKNKPSLLRRYYSQPISKTKYIYEDMSQYNEVCPFIIPLSLMVTSYKLYASNRKIQR